MKAVFTETGEEREVVAWCSRCKAMPDDWPDVIVSPTGMAHIQSDDNPGPVTRCGKQAEDWWWRE